MDKGAVLKRLSALLLRCNHSTAILPSPALQGPGLSSLSQHARGVATTAAAASRPSPPMPPAPPTPYPAAPAAAARQAGGAGTGGAGGNGSGGGGGGGGRGMTPMLLAPAVVAAGLGSWQLARRSEKQQQLDDRLAAMRVRTLPLPQ